MQFGIPLNQIPKSFKVGEQEFDGARVCFVPDPGMVMIGADYKAGESHIVAYVSGDQNYIDAHEGEYDPHTFVCKLTRSELTWTGDPKEDKKLAESILNDRGKDIRFLAKSTQHGSNLGGQPFTLAKNAGVSVREMEHAQQQYFETFPGIRKWQSYIRRVLQKEKRIKLPMVVDGLQPIRYFYNRPTSDSTWREALAFVPQGCLACYTHSAWMRCLKQLGVEGLIHNHDQLVFQVPEGLTDHYISHIKALMEWPVDIYDFRGKKRELKLRVDIKAGPNWKKVS